MLSLAGRACLMKSVLSSLLIFYLSFFKMPKEVTQKITSIQRRFLWSGEVGNEKIC